MQPVLAYKGVSTKSQLLDSLKVYLNDKNRLQPIIGLGSITECVRAGGGGREVLYLCEVCVCRLNKADMRNHIMGSLHRYNYVKARHPHLVSEWKETPDLSKLAWSLMEIANLLEGKEGPGDVQLLEVEDAVYQTMATHSENDAVTLINILRGGQGEPESHSETTSIQPQRIVLFGQKQRRCSKKSLKTSAETPSLIQSTVAPLVTSEGWLNDTPAPLLDNTWTSTEPTVLSENSESFLDGYRRTEPFIGLSRVAECRSEDGRTYCFLCHCCRVRANKKDIIDHLTSSSHLRNYLRETHPEQVEVEMEDVNDNYELLQLLAEKVEQEEGRGELKVVTAPESLCILLTGKSYHWCIKMLCNGWTHTNIQKKKMAIRGPRVTKTSNEGMPEKSAAVLSKCAKGMTAKRKMKKVTGTVFKVSLPLTKGSMLLERTSFCMDSLPVSSAYSPPPDSDLSPESEDYEVDSHVEHSSELQQDLYTGDGDVGQYMGPEINFSRCQEVDGYFGDNQYFNQSEDITGTKDRRFYGRKIYNRQHVSQESSNLLYKELENEGPQTPSEGLSVSHAQDWTPYNSYRHEEGYTEPWSSSASQSKIGTRVEASREERQSSDYTLYYPQQQPQNQHMARFHTSVVTGGAGPHLDAARVNTYPGVGEPCTYSSIVPEPRGQFLEIEQRRWQTYMEVPFGRVQTAPQSYTMPPTAYQATEAGHGGMFNPNYSTGPGLNPDQHFPRPFVLWSPVWS